MVVQRCEKTRDEQGTPKRVPPCLVHTMGEANKGAVPPGETEGKNEASRKHEPSGVLDRALSLVERLRRECPWDRAQTARSLVPHLLEESREAAEAILHGTSGELRDELGDLLLNLAFQIVVAEESGEFNREAVVRGLEEKMWRRHPHIFGEGQKESWEAIKAREREDRGEKDRGVLDGLPRGLDPLLRAHRIQDRVSGVGFDWSHARGALEKVREELDEVQQALEGEDAQALEEEVGDLLFAAVNLSRLAGVHATVALEGANAKFGRRFRRVEELAREKELPLTEAGLEELELLWRQAKREERPQDQ